MDERRTTPVELLWDLVFVFAVTQVTTLLSSDLTWPGFARAMLVLALVWWAWSAFVWAANAQASSSGALRVILLAATVFVFLTGLAVPRAFKNEATLFAAGYAVVRLLHLALYADASRKGDAAWSAIAGFAVTVTIGMVLLLAGSFASGALRYAMWSAAVAIDYAGPAWLTRERLRGLQQVAVAHFAERYGLFVIICLGESIVAVGVAAGNGYRPLSATLVLAVGLGVLITIGMWWTYFGRFAGEAEERLRRHRDPVLAAADAYSYLHLVIIAGIIIFDAGIKLLARGAVDAPLPGPERLALCGGIALYLLGQFASRLRLTGSARYVTASAAAALIALYVAGGGMPAWAVAAVASGLVGALCCVESAGEGRSRRRRGRRRRFVPTGGGRID
ncbi:MAG: low temperature requirement protein A [Solirubrobacterales bacterium]|nr:low temperature requirement protein A [Solirubrobacterales bacterium]